MYSYPDEREEDFERNRQGRFKPRFDRQQNRRDKPVIFGILESMLHKTVKVKTIDDDEFVGELECFWLNGNEPLFVVTESVDECDFCHVIPISNVIHMTVKKGASQ